MIDFIEYIVSELKSKRLSKVNALALIKQFSLRSSITGRAAVIHPLVHNNTSDLSQQSYSSLFSGNEFFLADHKVAIDNSEGKSFLPGVAYLEIARAAIEDALPESQNTTVLELYNVVWLQPIVVTKPKEIAIALYTNDVKSDDLEQIDYEVYSVESEQEVIHCQGQAVIKTKPAPVKIDIEKLKNQMQKGELGSNEIYIAFNQLGLNYGSAHQGITSVFVGDKQLLAQLRLPDVVQATQKDYVLHPSILDSALQSTLGMVDDLNQLPSQPSLPFAVESLRILSTCTPEMFAWVRYSEGSQRDDNIVKLDIELSDQLGNVCVQIRGFSSRVLTSPVTTADDKKISVERLLAIPVWKNRPIVVSSETQPQDFAATHILLCDMSQVGIKKLAALHPKNQCSKIKSTSTDFAQKYIDVTLECFEKTQAILKQKQQGKTLVQLVISNTEESSIISGLSGMFKTITQENPNLIGQIILTNPTITTDELSIQLQQEQSQSLESLVKYNRNQRKILSWQEIDPEQSTPSIVFKEQGVYLITGGLGGLGRIFAKEIINQTTKAKVIFSGRSALSKEEWSIKKQTILGENSSDMDRLDYHQLDIIDSKQVKKLVDVIQTDYAQLNGIIHCSGMILDNFVLNKTADEFKRVLEPKVIGSYNLDLACKDVELDFLVLFSSAVSVTGNLGQADYAAANGFMDQFAEYRNQLVSNKKRTGKTLSFNWPLWKQGGMTIDAASLEMLKSVTGMQPLQTSTGIESFYHGLSMQQSQCLVAEGDLVKMRSIYIVEKRHQSESHRVETNNLRVKDEPKEVANLSDSQAGSTEIDGESLTEKTRDYLRQQFAKVLKLSPQKINSQTSLENYGIDSILAMNLTSQLENTFGALSKTLMFEYRTIAELSDYFVQTYSQRLAQIFDASVETKQSVVKVETSDSQHQDIAVSKEKKVTSKRPARRRYRSVFSNNDSNSMEWLSTSNEPIAIIGLSGRYPESRDLEEYWKNLQGGKDCITEVPLSRWDWQEFYSEDRTKVGHHYSKWGGFIEGVDEFDPKFFNISPREAVSMDPQERIFLQHSWKAVEDAGYTRSSLQVKREKGLSGQVGVYVGVMYGEYNLSGSLASIANRVSSVLNLHGPSMTLDTMCSSSLTAIHLASQDLKQGRTDLAIAGGVNVSINPSKYMMLSAGQFISSDGHCQSFGDGGDGYIPGEGVGAVILKRLSDAKKDGHHIYAVIKGSALNHGGKTNGYTVPNPQAQADAISAALIESNIDPRHISYIEAHGTGTKLGDPIEIAALNRAFNQSDAISSSKNNEFGYCLLGSAKSNIGHCESAAGIAGLTKILLQMKHHQIVPSLHSKRLNPHIDFENTPFVVNQSLTDWNEPQVDGKIIPRIAGLSSFGAGGSNAHIIVQEYPRTVSAVKDNRKVIVPISARTGEQLEQKATELCKYIVDDAVSIDLVAMSYTLQVGREAMDERLCFVVSSIEELVEKLSAYIGKEDNFEATYQGQVKNDKSGMSIISEDDDMKEAIDRWIIRKKLSKLAELWVKGLELNWIKLYSDDLPQLISLPTYPFAKEKYWIDSAVNGPLAVTRKSSNTSSTTMLHPLLHANTSDFAQQSFSSTFSGDEIFFNRRTSGAIDSEEHFKTLANLALMEMVRAAVVHSLPTQQQSSRIELRNIVWGQPFSAGVNKQIKIALFDSGVDVDASEAIEYEIYSQLQSHEDVHCQGQAILSHHTASHRTVQAELDIGQLKTQLKQVNLEASGLNELHKDVCAIYRGEGRLLVELNLADIAENNQQGYIFHPAVVTDTMNIIDYFVNQLTNNAHQSFSPLALDSMQILSACAKSMFLWLRHSTSGMKESEFNLDVDLCDSQGNVCVQMRGLCLASLSENQIKNQTTSERKNNISLASPIENLDSQLPVLAKPSSIGLINLQGVSVIKDSHLSAASPKVALLVTPEEILENSLEVLESNVISHANKRSATVSAPLETANNRPDSVASESLTRSQLREELTDSLADALYMDASDIDLDKSFVDLGLDSIVGVEWVNSINKQYVLEISATRVYDYSNIKELAVFLEEELAKSSTHSAISEPVIATAAKIAAAPPVVIEKQVIEKQEIEQHPIEDKLYHISQIDLQSQLKESLADALYMEAADIAIDKSFVDLGLDSIVGVEWVNSINKQYLLEISATRVYDYSNIKELATFLAEELKKSSVPLQNIAKDEHKSILQETLTSDVPVAKQNISSLNFYPNLSRKLARNRRKVSFSNSLPVAQTVTQKNNNTETDKIAIVGMSGRYPQADNLQIYWDNLVNGKNSITEIPPSRWDVNQYYDPEPGKQGKIYCKWLGMLDDADCFDPLFFQISPSEAESMDPQHRLFMQESYRAFEDAGYSGQTLSNTKCGVYLGIMSSEYSFLLAKSDSVSVETTGNSFAIGAARIAYYLNLKGPAIPIDTACSSSLVAIHLGSQALLNNEIDMALAGGVSLYVIPESYLGMCRAGMLSPVGQCKTFDNSADGFVPGEGVGAVVLKRLKDAEADNDSIYGVILGSAINQDGKTNGITAPSVNSQIELERDLYSKYKIEPETISYVETHGTGTKLGDPIELEALATVFKEKTSQKNYCALGAVKSNIGHTSGAAGVASVQKVLLSMRHKTLVPSLNVEKENILFNFDSSPFYISSKKQAWKSSPDSLRRAAVSSFGFSGTNAHLVIEEYVGKNNKENTITAEAQGGDVIIPLSARTKQQLLQKARDLSEFLNDKTLTQSQSSNLKAIAYTLQVGRTSMKYRLGFVANSVEQLREKLSMFIDDNKNIDGIYQGEISRNQDTLTLFSSDDDLRRTVNNWIEDKKYNKLLDFWVKGLELDWNKLYQQRKPQRISLPTYPFAKESYWVDVQAQPNLIKIGQSSTAASNISTVPRKTEEKQKTYYYPQWQKKPLTGLNQVRLTQDSQMSGPILIIDTSDELSMSLKKILQNSVKDQAIISVRFASAYEQFAPNSFSVNPEQEAHFSQLIDELNIHDMLPRQIIHMGTPLSGLADTADTADIKTNEELTNLSNQGFYTLFNLCKTLMREKHQEGVQILSVYFSGATTVSIENAALSGFTKSLTLENPNYLAKIIEFETPQNNPAAANLKPVTADVAQLLLAEFREENWHSTEIRYQYAKFEKDHRYIRSVREFTEYDLAQNNLAELPLKHKGAYLITGGLGGLGMIFCEYLAKNYQANLVLLGRSKLTAEQQEKLDQWGAYNTNILYLQADISNLQEMQSVVDKTKAHFSEINGVIHSAGINKDSFILNKTRKEIDAVLQAKVHGTINLDQVTKTETLDLFVLFSSGAGSLGNAGQCDYAYANRFIDAFAEHREKMRKGQQRFGKTLSINWPFWEEGGMSVSENILTQIEKQTGMSSLPTDEGIQYWEDFLRSDLSQGLAFFGIPSLIKAHITKQPLAIGESLSIEALTFDSVTLKEKTRVYLTDLISEETKLAAELIATDERLESFGFDSIMIGRFNANLEKDLGALPKTLLYEYETIGELVQYLCNEATHQLTHYFAQQGITDPHIAQIEPILSTENEQQTFVHTPYVDEKQSEVESVAIIGIHGYYPHSNTLDDYWENLKQGKDLIDLVPGNRWDYEALYHPDPEKASDGKTYCKWGGFLDDFDKFDPSFFNVSADEAKNIDPQERLFLASVWSAIEDAGYTRESLKHLYPKEKSASVGVFAGVTTNSYHLLAAEEWTRGNMISPGALPWSIANRVSYFFDFQGPSMPIDTACSSSLVAIHLACESLKNQECQIAIAGGVNLYLHPSKYQSFCKRRMLSMGGKNCSFGAGDDGFVPGEGVGSLVLKPLLKAEQDNDHIYATISASAFEHCGRSNGYSAPNPNAQAVLIRETLHSAKIHPESIGYIEGHGTGTQLGDSLEISALTQAFRTQTQAKQFCPIGSVKANIGHSESAAGVAGVAKILLQMKHKQLVPSIHSQDINPNIEFEGTPFYLQHELSSWEPKSDNPRRAMINSFGAGGVNACVIIDEYQKIISPENAPEPLAYLFVLSAKNNTQLLIYIEQMIRYLESDQSEKLSDLCYTLQVGREAMPERLAIIFSDVKELIHLLKKLTQQQTLNVDKHEDVYRESLDARKGLKKFLNQNEKDSLTSAYQTKNMSQLAKVWVAGQNLDWEMLYKGQSTARISLPTYPFEKQRHWVSDGLPPLKQAISKPTNSQLHPLVSFNSSTLQNVRFGSLLREDEFYSLDHQVNNQKIFPGAGFLEIACISGSIASEQKVSKIRDVVWMQPLSFQQGSQSVQTLLKTIGNATEYEIISLDDENERVVHSEGRLFFQKEDGYSSDTGENISIQALKDQCSSVQDGSILYEKFEQHGFCYGSTFRTIEEFYANDSFALSKLKITDELMADFDQYIIHPSLIDGALQTVVGLIGNTLSGTPYLPFALDEVDIIRPITQTCYSLVEFAGDDGLSQTEIKKFNVKLFNEQGKILLKLNNFYVRALDIAPNRSVVEA